MIRETCAARESQFGQHASSNYTTEKAMLCGLVSESAPGIVRDANGPGTAG